MCGLLVLLFLGGVLGQERSWSPTEYHHHEVVEITEPSGEEFYHHSRVKPSKSGPDTLTSIGILVLLKLLVLKVKTLGLATILFLKLPVLLLILLVKLLVAVKLFKFAKLAMIPLFLPLLIPLLFAPLLLLPLLLPLLLLLPIPALQATTAPPAGRRKKREADFTPRAAPSNVLQALRMVVESDQCLERIACTIGSHRAPTIYSAFIAWILDKMRLYINNPRFESYVTSFNKGRSSRSNCQQYGCTNRGLNMFKY